MFLSVAEIIYTYIVYDNITLRQKAISREIDIDEENIDTDLAKKLSKECLEYWSKHKPVLMLVSNHMVVLELDKSMVKQQTLININQHPDCKVETMTIINSIKEIKKAMIPLYQNLL